MNAGLIFTLFALYLINISVIGDKELSQKSSDPHISNMYNSILRKLYRINLQNPVKMGLENSNKLYQLLGRPLDLIPVIHTAGTNGKGSVCLKTANVLRQGGLRTGLFVSPHISSFRERVQVNGECLTEEDVTVILFCKCKQSQS